MRALNRLFIRLGNAVRRRRGDRRFREEMESHLAAQTEENVRAGMTPEEARRQARLKLGAMEAVREEYLAEKSLPMLENLLLDLRYAVRVLRRSPAFTAVALVTLMLGIGANVVVFGVLNAVLLHPLDVREPQDLYQLRPKQRVSGRLLTTSYPAFEDLRRRSSSFSDMLAMNAYSHAELRGRGNLLMEVGGEEVSANYFDMLGVQPAVGQFFHAADDHGPGSAPYVVLSNDLWRNAFHGDHGIVGTTVEMNLHPFTVVGVAPAQFHGTEKFHWPDYWIPMANEAQLWGDDYLEDRASRLTVIGRVKPDVTAQQATENLNAIVAELAKEYPATDKGLAVRLIHPGLFGDDGEVIGEFLWSVTVLALLVLFAACANLATLFAARAADRTRELALRVALGSSRRRLMRQLLTEAMVVSLAGGAAGLAGAFLLLGMLNRWRPSFGGHLAISVDARVYLAGLGLTLGSALLFGMVPARQAWQSGPLQSMKSGPESTAHLRRFALRDVLLGVQIAICTLLVISSLVAVRGMLGALDGPLGIKPQGAMLAETDLSHVELGNDTALLQKQKAMMEAARSLPGVTTVGMTNATPLGGGGSKGIPVYWPGTTEFTLDKSALETRLYDISPGISGRCRHAAAWRARCFLARHGQDARSSDREPNVCPDDVGRNAGNRATLYSVGQADGSGGRGRRRQVPRPGGIAAAGSVSATGTERRQLRGDCGAVAPGAEPDYRAAGKHAERHRAGCAADDRELAQRFGGGAVPGKDGNGCSGSDGLSGGDAGGDGYLWHGSLQREPPDEGAGYPHGLRRAQDTSHERGGRAAHGAARRGIGGGSAGRRLRQPLVGADCLSGESAGSRGARRRSVDDGSARRRSLRHSGPASPCC